MPFAFDGNRAARAAGETGTVARLEHALSALRATLESTADGILVVDASGHWQSWNEQFLRIWDFPPGAAGEGDLERLRRHTASQVADPEAFVGRIREVYANPESESADELLLLDGRVVERVSKPLRVGGACVGRVWSFRDVTPARRQAAALHESERRLLQAQKFEALGRLAGGVAHDFNNMLTAILGETELVLGLLPADGEAREAAARIRGAAERSARLTQQLLSFSRHRRQLAVDVDVRQMLLDVEPILRGMAGPGRELRMWAPPASPALLARADVTGLEQAVLNLVVNAYDAMPGGGVADLRLFRETLSADEAARRGAPAAGDYACIEVADTGTGIAPEIRPHLFEPFFTTRPKGGGGGLGLAWVRGAALDAGGFVEVESEPGRGAAFRILLPVPTGRPAGSPPAARAPAPAPGDRRAPVVLLAEDEDAVRTFVRTVLVRDGLRVVEATDAEEALAAFETLPEPPALLLTDVRMPGLSGVELARRLRARRPDLPVLLMSGWPGEAASELEGAGLRLALVAKPFTGAELVAAAHAEMASAPPAPAAREGESPGR